MATVYLIRHGMTDVAGKRLSGRMAGVHLNAEGRAQVARLGELFAGATIDTVYSSPLERAMETAHAIADPLGLSIETSERLLEVDFGEWTGRRVTEMADDPKWRRWNALRGESRSPGGESMLEVQVRMVEEILAIAKGRPRSRVAVVSHEDPIRAAIAYFLGVPLDLFLRLTMAPASVSIVELEEWEVTVRCYNTRPYNLLHL